MSTHRAAAYAYRNLGDSSLTVEQLSKILEGPNGILTLISNSQIGDDLASEAVTAITTAAFEIGEFTNPTPIIFQYRWKIPDNFLIPTREIYDPAVMAFILTSLLLQHAAELPEKAGIYTTAFKDIHSSLLTTVGNVAITDLTYISAICHHADLAAGFTPAIPIISFKPMPESE